MDLRRGSNMFAAAASASQKMSLRTLSTGASDDCVDAAKRALFLDEAFD